MARGHGFQSSRFRITAAQLAVSVLLFSSPTEAFVESTRWQRGGSKIHHPPLRRRHPACGCSAPPGTTTARFAGSNKRNGSSPGGGGGGRVRFSTTDATLTNPLDAFLSFVASDVASIALGLIGLFLVVGHRAAGLDQAGVESLAVQTRTDLLATFACGSVLLEGITKLDVTTALAEEVVLEGFALPSPEILDSDRDDDDGDEKSGEELLRWGLESLLVATPAKTAVVVGRKRRPYSDSETSSWSVVARSGVVPSATGVPGSAPILERVGTPGNTVETYLPTLQALPGKTEFPYLPSNAQLALLVPMIGEDDDRRVLVLGGDVAKSFSPRDVAWARIVAERMGNRR